MRFQLKIGLATILLTAAGASHVQAQMRFQGMDSNNDGMVTRDEWRGADSAFRVQDWNGDGVLSGDEVRPGARRQTSWNQDWNRDGIIDQQDTLVAQRFRNYDNNSDSRVAANEWPGNVALFRRLDTNRDGYLTMTEYTNNGGFRAPSQGGPQNTFGNLDKNRDGWITRSEWNMDNAAFTRLDANRDNRISNLEFQADSTGNDNNAVQQFIVIDRNRDGWITRPESGMTNAEFNRLDTNSDNRLNRYEFESMATDNWNSQFVNEPFQNIDSNRDGWVARAEWQWDAAAFNRIDTNNDNRISRFEFERSAGQGVTPDRFSGADGNRDGYIARSEWSWGNTWFDRVDENRDNRVSRSEFEAVSRFFNESANRFEDTNASANEQANQRYDQANQRTRAFQAGFDRGIDEGRMAGREDHLNGHGWDLEGQTELERADSGHNSQLGSLSEYQSGYRDGFRQAYREGYNSQ